MRWLIAEDALKNRTGHWFEYVRTFRNGLLKQGDEVAVLASKNAEPFIQAELAARPVLPESIWHQMGDGSGVLKRYLRVPVHAFKTWRRVGRELRTNAEYDVIFVPTMSVHHLLGWVRLIKGKLHGRQIRVLLYFLSTPIQVRNDGKPEWIQSPTTRLMARLLAGLRNEIKSGKVAIGVETRALQRALSQVAGIQVRYLPQPVDALPQNTVTAKNSLLFACYGVARHEKGSDLLQSAIIRFFQIHPQSRARFAIQWIDDFSDETGHPVTRSPILLKDDRVEFITHFFQDGEYDQRLAQTCVMLLPYRLSSYRLRGSRVVIEAMVNGIPVVATRGTTLAQQAEEFGAVELCENEDVESLVKAIETAERNYAILSAKALDRQSLVRAHFSTRQFRDLLLSDTASCPN